MNQKQALTDSVEYSPLRIGCDIKQRGRNTWGHSGAETQLQECSHMRQLLLLLLLLFIGKSKQQTYMHNSSNSK